MTLTPEQKHAVAGWVAAGDNLSTVQKKLADTFKLSMTYMDVRFLVDDLNLALKDAAPKADASDVSKTPPRPPAEKTGEKKGLIDRAKEKLGLGGAGEAQAPDEAALDEDEFPDDQSAFPDEAGLGAGGVTVSVDKVTLHPGALASGSVTFSDGVTAKWLVDNYGRPGFSEVSQPGYRPSPADAQAFMQELSVALQSRGF